MTAAGDTSEIAEYGRVAGWPAGRARTARSAIYARSARRLASVAHGLGHAGGARFSLQNRNMALPTTGGRLGVGNGSPYP